MNDADQNDEPTVPAGTPKAVTSGSLADLKPKGACWYCNQPLDNVRRFCSKTCADDYRVEEEVFNNPAA
ncbi:hypothetical protein [Noviherbaspirillum sp.]|uniref:hypothetical protein n=1 Tax=Noviherbaspirillum sp. TaxID=1926288 RepID=UPI002D67BDFB|nr:hypothetical protein [Noviherbaspirillum sp.]HZW23133.1 hypothetical protein [Noviherbaspirillum sp.]